MDALERLLGSFAAEEVTAVEVPGYQERGGGRPEFVPWASTAYLRGETALLRLDSVGNRGQLALELVPAVTVPEPLLREEEEFATTDYAHLFFGEASARRLIRVRYAVNDESDPGQPTVRCAEFTFTRGAVLFADPMWTFGLRLGGEGAYDRWAAETRESPELPFRERLWAL